MSDTCACATLPSRSHPFRGLAARMRSAARAFVARTRGRGLEEPAAVARRAGRRMEMMTAFSATVGAVREAAAE